MLELRQSYKDAIEIFEKAIGRKHKKNSYFIRKSKESGIVVIVAQVYKGNILVIKHQALVHNKRVYVNNELFYDGSKKDER